jgi:hypothetical protein
MSSNKYVPPALRKDVGLKDTPANFPTLGSAPVRATSSWTKKSFAVLAAECDTHAKEEKERESSKAASEKLSSVAVIDWHDFVVVETIDFKDDESESAAAGGVFEFVRLLSPACNAIMNTLCHRSFQGTLRYFKYRHS